MFISMIAYETPSAMPPYTLIIAVIIPHPIANIILPFGVTGQVTKSVAMKKAPKISPPPSIWYGNKLMSTPNAANNTVVV